MTLINFVNAEFPGLLAALEVEDTQKFIEHIKILVFVHRYNKNDEFLAERLIDFKIVRDPSYKYSRSAQDTFFNHSTFAFLFVWFAAFSQARKQIIYDDPKK